MEASRTRTIARWALSFVALAISWFALSWLDGYAEQATLDALFRDVRESLDEALQGAGHREQSIELALSFDGHEPAVVERLTRHLGASRAFSLTAVGEPLVLRLDMTDTRAHVEATHALSSDRPVVVAVGRDRIDSASLFPAIAAIVLAFATGRVVLSLGLAVLVGALLSVGPSPFQLFPHAAKLYFFEATLTDAFKLWIIAFTCCLLGLVRLASRAGGVEGVVDRIAGRVRGPRSAQRATALMGLTVFFDDYANTVLVGSTMRPLSDRLRIAREKLAFIVDSTAAPLAGIALVSTWIGFEIGLLSDAARSTGLDSEGYALFLKALPFRFYCIFTLALVAIVVLTGRDFGPMLRAERRAASTGALFRPGSRPLVESTLDISGSRAEEGMHRMAHVALLPIGAVLLGTIVGLYLDGGGSSMGLAGLLSLHGWQEAFGAAENSTFVMAMATVAGSLVLFALVAFHRLLSFSEAARAYLEGIWSMRIAVIILLLAWAMKAVCDDLGADHLLVAALGDSIPPLVVPLVVFFLAAIIAFATGTSWGTMAILIPVAVPLSFEVGGAALSFLTMAAVLDGAIFGDHCSPISDTTVMSSIATGCDHMDHVKTQAPYALLSMTTAALFGYLWNASGLPWWLGIALGLSLLVVAVRLLGKDARANLDLEPGPAPLEDREPSSTQAPYLSAHGD